MGGGRAAERMATVDMRKAWVGGERNPNLLTVAQGRSLATTVRPEINNGGMRGLGAVNNIHASGIPRILPAVNAPVRKLHFLNGLMRHISSAMQSPAGKSRHRPSAIPRSPKGTMMPAAGM